MAAVIIQEFPNYSINEVGEITNIRTGKRLINTTSKNGYSIVCLYNEYGRKIHPYPAKINLDFHK